MAYISEVHYRSDDIPETQNEFVEVVLGPNDDPADFVLSFYNETGVLDANVQADGVTNGEVTLADLTGTVIPGNPNHTIYLISSTSPPGTLMNGFPSSSPYSANSVALTNTSTGTVVDAYSIFNNPSQTLSGGAADGAVTTSTGGAGSLESLQWDSLGNETSAAQTPNETTIVCFTAGTLIRTPKGDVPVQNLSQGDLVLNADGAALPIRWIGSRKLTSSELHKNPKLRPVRITAGALGPNVPSADLLVSRQHRMLVRSRIASRMFGTDEVLVGAAKLTQLPGVFIDPVVKPTEYFHILFDDHEIIFAEGAETESFHTGAQAMQTISDEARAEIMAIFPDRFHSDVALHLARKVPEDAQQRRLIERHAKNNKHALEAC